jgi:transposase InsO family protein
VADITQQRTGEGWLYLAVVLDAFSRRVVGWSMADHLRTELVLDALDMAIAQRSPTAGLVHHSDHGCQPRFKGSSQHCLVGGSTVARPGPQQVFSSRGSCGVGG